MAICNKPIFVVGNSVFNPLYTGGLFQCYMLDEFICHCRGVRSILGATLESVCQYI